MRKKSHVFFFVVFFSPKVSYNVYIVNTDTHTRTTFSEVYGAKRIKVYVHCIHCVYGHRGVDSKDKLYTFYTLC